MEIRERRSSLSGRITFVTSFEHLLHWIHTVTDAIVIMMPRNKYDKLYKNIHLDDQLRNKGTLNCHRFLFVVIASASFVLFVNHMKWFKTQNVSDHLVVRECHFVGNMVEAIVYLCYTYFMLTVSSSSWSISQAWLRILFLLIASSFLIFTKASGWLVCFHE